MKRSFKQPLKEARISFTYALIVAIIEMRSVTCIIKSVIVFIVLLGLQVTTKGQNSTIQLPFKYITGTERVDVLNQLCFRLLWERPYRSLEYAEASLSLADSVGYEAGKAKAHHNIGNAHLYGGSFEKSLFHYQQAQYLFDSLQDQHQALLNKVNIACIFIQLEDYQDAQQLLGQTRLGFEQLNDSLGLGIYHRYYGSLLLKNERLDSAKYELTSSLKIMTSIHDTLGIVLARGQLGDVYVTQKAWEKANAEYEKALKLIEGKNLRTIEVMLTLKAAKLFELQGKDQLALAHYERAISVANGMELRVKEMDMHLHISRLYEKIGKHNLALVHFHAYASMKDSVINMTKNEQIADLQIKYQMRSQAQKMEELQLEGRLQRSQIVSLIVIAALLIAGFWIWYMYKRKAERKLKKQYQEIQRKNQIIKLKREEVEIANKELRNAQGIIKEQNEKLLWVNANLEGEVEERTKELQEAIQNLIKSNEELDMFIYRSSHDIKGPLSTLAGLCLLAGREIKDQVAKGYVDHIQRTVSSTMKQLDNLMRVYEIKHLTIAYEDLEMPQALQEIISEKLAADNYCKAEIELTISNPFTCRVDLKMLRLAIHNLLDNSMTYYHEQVPPKIHLEVTEQRERLLIDVKDNGTGIFPEAHQKVFNMFFRGSEKSVGSGLGLYICKLIIKRLNGEISLQGSSSKGSHFRIALPLK